ncbi:MAG: hypothetical protein KAT14_08570, partial [Candidatus Marinimicrobia bacterium]|nr:hypothetical protein [Candidatus Neomarinimicrobiota bacterium]
MDIKKIVDEQTEKLVESGELEKMVAENVELSIRKVIADKFGSYSFQRDLEKKLSAEMEPLLEEISFSGYRDVIIDRIKKVLTGLVDTDLVKKAEKAYKDIFIMADKPLKMSEFFEIVNKEYSEDAYNYGEYFKAEIENDKNDGDFQWYTVRFTENSDDKTYENSFRIMAYKNELFKIKSLKTEHLSYDKENKALLKVDYLRGFERILLNAYINDQKIEMDIDSVDDIDCSK